MTAVEKAWNFYKSIGSPKFIVAPMVDQSELPFRILTRKYGGQLCYTPMLHSKMLIIDKNYKKVHFQSCPEDRPLIAQLCGDDPKTLLAAGKMLEDEVDAIDLNFGCPQGIARKGHYGSYLLEETELIKSIVSTLSNGLKVPVTCKIRILPSEEETLKLCKAIEESGCSILTVHGRTKEQNKHLVKECDWGIISRIKEIMNIPVFANGGIYNFSDVENCLKETSVDGVMTAEAILENPAIFSNGIRDLDDLALEYLELTQVYKSSPKYIKPHLFKILYQGLKENTDLRDKLSSSTCFTEYKAIALELKTRRLNTPLKDKFGWYHRYNTFAPQNNSKVESKEENENNVHENYSPQQICA